MGADSFWYWDIGAFVFAGDETCVSVSGKKYATSDKKIAEENHCYKMMLLTGSKEERTLNFYRNAGYNSSDKTAFIQWIDM